MYSPSAADTTTVKWLVLVQMNTVNTWHNTHYATSNVTAICKTNFEHHYNKLLQIQYYLPDAALPLLLVNKIKNIDHWQVKVHSSERDTTHVQNMVLTSPHPIWHFDRLSRWRLTPVTDKQTDRHTCRLRYMCNSSPHLMQCIAIRPKTPLIIMNNTCTDLTMQNSQLLSSM